MKKAEAFDRQSPSFPQKAWKGWGTLKSFVRVVLWSVKATMIHGEDSQGYSLLLWLSWLR